MAFQTPLTIEEMLRGIHEKKYLLPAIQREFVWSADQIRVLVDSLLRGYPIGSFLVWDVKPGTAEAYTFYDFLTNYHERDRPHATRATVPAGSGTLAVLDGQQRLTALNIAFYGSHSSKKKHARWSSPDAFPLKRLHLNLADVAQVGDLGLEYDLQFLTADEARRNPGEPDKWFPVGDVLQLGDSGRSAIRVLKARSFDVMEDEGDAAHDRLEALHSAVKKFSPINYFLESSQDSDKVLDIFVRVNSGGTKLSSSDLLLSMATNQWANLDAREEVRSAVHELNSGGGRSFAFDKDIVLKTALMIAGVDMRFKVSNFTEGNMRRVEAAWPDAKAALIRAAALLGDFGFSARTLTAATVVRPVAYYLFRRGLGDSYLEADRMRSDRIVVQKWVTRSLMKRGVWGSGLDTLLQRLRGAIDDHGAEGFPVDEIEKVMAPIGKSLSFDPAEVDELLEVTYGRRETFPVLAIMYPGIDLTKQFHEDHIFPKSRFSKKREIIDAGLNPERVEDYRELADSIVNLQLLEGTPNVEKQALLPAEWLDKRFMGEPLKRQEYVDRNDLDGLPADLAGFEEFCARRRSRMRARLRNVLGVEGTTN